MKERKFNKSEYDQQYTKANCKRVMLSFNKSNDAQILDMLDQQGNKTEYIRNLIQKDIKKKENRNMKFNEMTKRVNQCLVDYTFGMDSFQNFVPEEEESNDGLSYADAAIRELNRLKEVFGEQDTVIFFHYTDVRTGKQFTNKRTPDQMYCCTVDGFTIEKWIKGARINEEVKVDYTQY